MWTGKCSQCIALLSWDCRKGGDMAWNVKEMTAKNKASYSSNWRLEQGMKKSKDCDGEEKKELSFSEARGDLKTKSFRWMGCFVWAGRFSTGVNEKKRTKRLLKGKDHVIPKGVGKKKPLWSEIIHGVTVMPGQYYSSALTSWLEVAFCFVQGTLE